MRIKKITNISKVIRIPRNMLFISIGIILLFLAGLLLFSLYYKGRIMPNVFVGNVYLGGLKMDEAESRLSSQEKVPEKIRITVDKEDFYINLKELEFFYNTKEALKNAYFAKRSVNNTVRLVLNNKIVLEPTYAINNQILEEKVDGILDKINIEPVYPYLYIKEGVLDFEKGKPGKIVEKGELLYALRDRFLNFNFSPIIISSKIVDVTLDDQKIQNFKERGEKIIGKKMILKGDNKTFEYPDEKLIKLLDPNTEFNLSELDLIIKEVESQLNREPQDSIFIFEEGKVKEFTPSSEGVRVDPKLLSENILNYLKDLEKQSGILPGEQNDKSGGIGIEIPLTKISPNITTANINNLGINELIGKGNSKFASSIPSRIHNISLASSKFNGVLIAPGETFSFNKTLGDVSNYTGYKQAYIIREGQTVLGDGGGVCQVSTTLFRATLNAGLPIVERQAHSYRVGYYEQDSPPGIDATVYDPSADLKFINNTPKSILIQTKVDTNAKTLVFELYGTNDGRVVTMSKPIITNLTPPPEDLYIDDPTLPMGQLKQIDFKAWGAKVYFKYSVERNGEIVFEKTFYSNYQPWQAKFLRGTGSN
jgi:vancomycin resistance protein YoaR